MDVMQSVFRFLHSTETVYNILSALDEGSAVVLLMLDLSAGFDNIDHEILSCLGSKHTYLIEPNVIT